MDYLEREQAPKARASFSLKPQPRPRIRRPPLITSIIACSSATVSGCERNGRALPKMAIFTRLVFRANAEAVTTGDGIRPYAVW